MDTHILCGNWRKGVGFAFAELFYLALDVFAPALLP